MAHFRRLGLVLAALALAAPAGAQQANAPPLAELTAGTRIRASGPAVRDAIGPSLGEVLRRGLGIGVAAGSLLGVATLGHRWERVYPAGRAP